MGEAMERYKEGILELLYDDTQVVGKVFAKAQDASGRKREEVLSIFFIVLAVYLVIGNFARFVCNTICFAYPAYESIKAIESTDKSDDTQWLIYWTVFALFSLLDFFADKIMQYFPFYWLFKCIYFMWLYLPMCRGAELVYKEKVRSIALKYILKKGDGEGDAPPAGEGAN